MKYDSIYRIPNTATSRDADYYIEQMLSEFRNSDRLLELSNAMECAGGQKIDNGMGIVDAFAEFLALPGNSFGERLATINGGR